MAEIVPETCRTWLQTRRGRPEQVLVLEEEHAVPRPGPGQVLVRVKACALNPVGHKVMGLAPWPVVKLPMIPEQDFSGTVVDANGTQWVNGAEVLGWTEMSTKFMNGKGAMSEYVAVEAASIIPKPSQVPFNVAAGLTTVGLTAYRTLYTPTHPIRSGQSVLINGGSSSVGIAAIQIAKISGAKKIVTICSSEKTNFVKSLGADEVLDYKSSPLVSQLIQRYSGEPFDLIVDAVGGPEIFLASTPYLKENGAFVTVSASMSTAINTVRAMFTPTFMGGVRRKFILEGAKWDDATMKQMASWIAEGKMSIPIDSTYKSDHAGVLAAYAKLMGNKAKGKVIVEL